MHLSDGTLRRSVDERHALDAVRRRHLEACSRCRRRAELLQADSQRVAAFLTAAAIPAPDTAAALRGLYARLPEPEREPVARPRWLRDPRRRARATRWSATALGAASVGVVLVGAGAAQGFITIFQPEQLAPVAVSAADVSSLQELASYGEVSGVPTLTLTPTSRQGALQATGIDPPQLSALPSGLPSTPAYDVIGGGTVTFTFDPARAAAAALAHGATLPPMPADVGHSTLQLTLPSALVEIYGTGLSQLLPRSAASAAPAGTGPDVGAGSSGDLSAVGTPSLAIVAARLPVVSSTGVSAARIEAYLLAQPAVPAGLAAEIHALADPATTLPVPIPISLATSETVSVDGARGLLIGDETGAGSLVLWEHDGVVYAVVGTVTSGQVLDVADQIG